MRIYAYHPQNANLKGPYDITDVEEEPVRRLAKQFRHSIYFFAEEPEPEEDILHLTSDDERTWCGKPVDPDSQMSETAPLCRGCANDLMGEFKGAREALVSIAQALDSAYKRMATHG